jgi:glycosyltransferase involved in cell wall biosynthesis
VSSDNVKKLLIISTEPAPYKIDLYNAFAKEKEFNCVVFYTCKKDWAKDGSHKFQIFPQSFFSHYENNGKGIFGNLFTAIKSVTIIFTKKPDIILVCGYSALPYLISMFAAFVKGIPFALLADQFNNHAPKYRVVLLIRNIIRKFVFSKSFAILTCGAPGKKSAEEAGSPPEKIIDFPYVIDQCRLKQLAGNFVDKKFNFESQSRPFILFSGRLIERKGLNIVLEAAKIIKKQGHPFFLIIEGDGPLKSRYERLVHDLSLQDSCIFTGFSQMDEHAYLLSIADIVVVPSFKDHWGIAVHEAMLMGKPVCASNAVGCAMDRIEDGKDGLLYESTNVQQLVTKLIYLIENEQARFDLGNSAAKKAEKYSPKRNVEYLLQAISKLRRIAT